MPQAATGSPVVPVTYAVQGEKSSPRFARAFALGCRGDVTPDDVLLPGPVALFGSPARRALLTTAIAEGREWYYGDHGFFRRFQYYRVTRNAYQWQPVATSLSTNARRFSALRVQTAPAWRTDGSAIVVCPNSPTYMRWFGLDAHQWVLDVVSALGTLTDRPIVVRWKSTANSLPIYVDLHMAWMVVVFSSAAAVDGLMAGVPICTLAPWATTASMGITDLADINTPVYPPIDQRDRFLFTLANHQFTLDEIERGIAWRHLQREHV